jgi:THAP domain
VNCRRKDLDGKSSNELNKKFRLCSNHFEETMYYATNIGGKRLILAAVPTIFDVPNPPARVAMKIKAPAKRLFTPPTKKLSADMDTLNSNSKVMCGGNAS